MASFHKNAILTGYVDHYCLACEAHLKGEDDITGHIAKPIHKKNLDAAAYVVKFADDCVRKVKRGYYCEYCNVLVSTAAKVNLHVEEVKHASNKGASLLIRSGASVLAFHDVFIDEQAWHGLIETTCATCNVEFEDEQIHKTDAGHILSLVQSQVEFGPGKLVYRKIDDGSFQCLTCNKVLAIANLDNHFEQTEHKNSLKLVKIRKTDDNTPTDENTEAKAERIDKNVNKTITEINKNDNKAIANDKIKTKVEKDTKVEEKVTKKQEVKTEQKSKPFELKFHFGDIPKKKVESKQETVEPKTELKKINEEKMKTETRPPIKLAPATTDLDEEICKVLGAKDYVAQDENGKRWCLLCDWTMENSAIDNHVRGRHHQTMYRMHKERIAEKMQKPEANAESEIKKIEVKESIAEVENKANILDNVSRFASNEININFESKTAVCKKCSKHVDFNYDTIENHIEEHKKENKVAKKEAASAKKDAANDIHRNEKATDFKTTKVENDAKKINTVTKSNENEAKKPNVCSKNNESETPKANPKTNENSARKDRKASIKTDKSSSRSSSVASKDADDNAENYAKVNDLIHNRGGATVYCKTCDSKLPFAIKNMREHITGLSHKKKAAMTLAQKPKMVTKTSMKEFLKILTAVETSMTKDVILNEKFCVNVGSFMMIAGQYGGLVCFACDVHMHLGELDIHYSLPPHEKAMKETLVVTSFDTEFIRELRPGHLHCGYCNMVSTSQELDSHLSTTGHRESKAYSRWRLQRYMHDIALQRRQDMELGMLLSMINLNDK